MEDKQYMALIEAELKYDTKLAPLAKLNADLQVHFTA